MSTHSLISPNSACVPVQAAESIQRAMARFPLIVETLDQLAKADVPLPGDSDIRHGCERALTAMMFELARIQPAPAGKGARTEAAFLAMLHTEAAVRLIDADRLQRMQVFIERVFAPQQQPN